MECNPARSRRRAIAVARVTGLAEQAVCCELVSAAEIPDLQGKYREMRETSLQDGTRFSVSARSRGLARHVP
jgi:ferric-dicitrate binding protein FerR (iron transport regulator)